YRLHSSSGKLPSWDFGLSKLPQPKTPEFLGRKWEKLGEERFHHAHRPCVMVQGSHCAGRRFRRSESERENRPAPFEKTGGGRVEKQIPRCARNDGSGGRTARSEVAGSVMDQAL